MHTAENEPPYAVAAYGSAPRQVSPSFLSVLRIAGYVAVLLLLADFALVGIAGLPMQFVLKNQLKLSPTQLSVFGALSGAPAYVGFAFGFLRDRWRPFGKGDRGYFLVLPLLLAVTCFYLAAFPFTYARLLGTSIVQAVIGLLLGAATHGMTTEIAQRNGMSGRLSVLMLVIPSLVGIASNAVGGHFSHTSAQQHNSLLISAFMCLPMMAMAFWMPGFVFATGQSPQPFDTDEHAGMPDEFRGSATDTAPTEGTVASLLRLARTRSIYLPAAAIFLFSFAPGWGTPLFYYLTDKVKLSEAAFGNATALSGFGFLGATLSYMLLCNKASLKTNLIVGTLLAVVGCPLYLLIHNPLQANIISIIAGASCGIAVCSYRDLLIRSCPQRLEGTAFLFTGTAGSIAGAGSDIFGSWLYEKGGFGLALAVTTLTTALIFVVIHFIPRALLTPREGEPLVPAAPLRYAEA